MAITITQSPLMEAPYKELTGDLNKFMTEQAALPYIMNLPNYDSMLRQSSGNTGSLLRGEVPEDVKRQIQQAGAERGVATGGPASPGANAAWLRALGLTSAQLQQQGQQNFSQLIADTPITPLFNPASLFIPERLAGQEWAANVAGRMSIGGSGAGIGSGSGVGSSSSSSRDPMTQGYPGYTQEKYGFKPNSRENSWNLPYSIDDSAQGFNSGPLPYESLFAQPGGSGTEMAWDDLYAQPGGGGFGNWSDMNSDYYTLAQDQGYQGVPQYDYNQMFSDAGAEFTDWSQSDFDWSQYE